MAVVRIVIATIATALVFPWSLALIGAWRLIPRARAWARARILSRELRDLARWHGVEDCEWDALLREQVLDAFDETGNTISPARVRDFVRLSLRVLDRDVKIQELESGLLGYRTDLVVDISPMAGVPYQLFSTVRTELRYRMPRGVSLEMTIGAR
jgi:hypothetical protein